MKTLLTTLAALIAASLLLAQPSAPEPATYVDQAKVAELFAKGGRLVSNAEYSASGSRRAGPGQVEIHEKETDIFLITEGAATFVTGGKMLNGKQSKAAQWIGSDIEGGVTHKLKKGDFITIPAGTPHWFKEVAPGGIAYYMVKVIRP
jgi:mannose-6-phosphate isomerase-like protein (cupin superfamily)